MLKEISRIARDMLFIHGHLTQPKDWLETAAPEPAAGETTLAEPKPESRRRARAARCEAALFAIGLGHAGSFR